jgi:hypothetical protein
LLPGHVAVDDPKNRYDIAALLHTTRL